MAINRCTTSGFLRLTKCIEFTTLWNTKTRERSSTVVSGFEVRVALGCASICAERFIRIQNRAMGESEQVGFDRTKDSASTSGTARFV